MLGQEAAARLGGRFADRVGLRRGGDGRCTLAGEEGTGSGARPGSRGRQRNLTSETHQAVATSEGYVLDTGSSAARGFSQRVLRAQRRRTRRRSGSCRGWAGSRHLPALEQALRGIHVHDQPVVLVARELELIDRDSQSGRVGRRVMRR
jgi:hypothetical protein